MKKTRKKKNKVVSLKNSGFYFDNCAICQAMAEAGEEGRSLSMDELTKAFRETNRKANTSN